MMFVMTSALSISMPAHAYNCDNVNSFHYDSIRCGLPRKQGDLEAAKTEFMKQEAELMRQKTRILRECASSYPPSWCKNISQH